MLESVGSAVHLFVQRLARSREEGREGTASSCSRGDECMSIQLGTEALALNKPPLTLAVVKLRQ